MKTNKILLIFILLLFIGKANAQQAPDFAAMGANKADASSVPESYDFSWKYTMEIQSEGGKTMNANYLLQPNADYFGMSMPQANGMLIVIDTKKKISVTAFDRGGQKMAMASKTPDYSDMVKKQGGDKKFTYKTLPEKTILGYKCKGIEATDENNTVVFYFTNDAPVNFADMFKSPQAAKMPDAFKSYFKPGDKPLMLSIDITDKAKSKTTKMTCTALEKEAFAFKKADYKFM